VKDETFDFTVPFLVLVRDRDPSPGATLEGYFESLWSVYLCNPSAEPLRAMVGVSGFFSDAELGVIESIPKPGKAYVVEARSYVCIENPSDDELDELVCNWTIDIQGGHNPGRYSFSAGKRRYDVTWLHDIPVFGKAGGLISRT
jgi:hypothetical protein